MKKIVLVLVSFSLIFSFLNGAKKKKKNINKYIFECYDTLVVFDGEKKEVQKKKFNATSMLISYFPKYQKIAVRTYTGDSANGNNTGNLYLVSSTNLSKVKKISLKKLEKEGKMSDTLAGLGRFSEDTALFTYQAGDNVGLLLRGIERDQVERGQVMCKPGSINPHNKFKAQVYILNKEEGGRHKPIFTGYKPQFYFRTTDITGSIKLAEGTEMLMPGDNAVIEVELINTIAMGKESKFAIREGGKTVGSGVVTEVVS